MKARIGASRHMRSTRSASKACSDQGCCHESGRPTRTSTRDSDCTGRLPRTRLPPRPARCSHARSRAPSHHGHPTATRRSLSQVVRASQRRPCPLPSAVVRLARPPNSLPPHCGTLKGQPTDLCCLRGAFGMRRNLFFLLFAGVAMATTAARAEDPKRLALLIGNQGYTEQVGRLKNPHNDVDLIEASLERLNFKVTVLKDANYKTIDIELKRYVTAVRRAGAAAV